MPVFAAGSLRHGAERAFRRSLCAFFEYQERRIVWSRTL
nr:MAG TPA_asm: hypothetical protein [Caudoviricetes sp.]